MFELKQTFQYNHHVSSFFGTVLLDYCNPDTNETTSCDHVFFWQKNIGKTMLVKLTIGYILVRFQIVLKSNTVKIMSMVTTKIKDYRFPKS